jgi:hypothetical protein
MSAAPAGPLDMGLLRDGRLAPGKTVRRSQRRASIDSQSVALRQPANFNPHAATAVDFHNNPRAPLLLVSGGNDHVSPASVVEANFKLYRNSTAVTQYKDFPGRTHYTLGQDGWEEVADYALTWAENHSQKSSTASVSSCSVSNEWQLVAPSLRATGSTGCGRTSQA